MYSGDHLSSCSVVYAIIYLFNGKKNQSINCKSIFDGGGYLFGFFSNPQNIFLQKHFRLSILVQILSAKGLLWGFCSAKGFLFGGIFPKYFQKCLGGSFRNIPQNCCNCIFVWGGMFPKNPKCKSICGAARNANQN